MVFNLCYMYFLPCYLYVSPCYVYLVLINTFSQIRLIADKITIQNSLFNYKSIFGFFVYENSTFDKTYNPTIST